jgi:hypothetical protein
MIFATGDEKVYIVGVLTYIYIYRKGEEVEK